MPVNNDSDHLFSGSIPEIYDRLLVPLIFETYARDLADRVKAFAAQSVLEVAAGTGVVTRAMSSALSPSVSITATDLNAPMVDYAKTKGTERPVDWRVADAMKLPFDDATFDTVVCQFGVMFFPDRVGAYRDVRRVLKPGGTFLFNVWDHIDHNEFAAEVTSALAGLFSDDPPVFMARTPHGYFDGEAIQRELGDALFDSPVRIEALEARSRATSAHVPSVAYCHGTPLRNEIEARAPGRLDEVTTHVTAALSQRFGEREVDGRIRAFVVTADKT